LFSGIGGFDLAAEWMGWQNLFHCEWNEFGQRILKHYWPRAKSYGDITKTDFTIWRGRIDILTGGFPCQPFSQAGNRNGIEDGRYLWPEYLRAIREIKPITVVGENVTGILTMEQHQMFARVDGRRVVRFENYDEYEAVYTRQRTLLVNDICEDLEKEGYEVQTFVIPAAGVNAPHRRDRIWFIANSVNNGNSEFSREHEGKSQKERLSERNKVQWAKKPVDLRPEMELAITDSESIRGGGLSKRKEKNDPINGIIGKDGNVADTGSSGRVQDDQQFKSGKFEHARTGWERFPTQSPVCTRNDGISSGLDGITFPKWRSESIKGAGNAICPQVAYEIFKAIENGL
jgi:DNA (cytosine-5)-methyltransferase 1